MQKTLSFMCFRKTSEEVSKFLFPKTSIALIAFFIAIVIVVQYSLWILFPLPNTEFSGTYDKGESGLLNGMRSVGEGFINYYKLEGEPVSEYFISDIIGYGPVYLDVFMGVVSLILAGNILFAYVLIRFVFTFLLVIAAYHIFMYLSRNAIEAETGFYLYVASAGFGGLLYFLAVVVLGSNPITPNFFGFGVGLLRVAGFYLSASISLSLIAISLVLKNKTYIAALVSGIVALIYPSHSIVVFFVAALHLFLSGRKLDIAKFGIINAVFMVSWLVPYALNKHDFSEYLALNAQNSVIFFPSVVLGFGPAIFFVFYRYRRILHVKQGASIVIAITASSLALSVAFLRDISVHKNVSLPDLDIFYSLQSFAAQYFVQLQMPFVIVMIFCAALVYSRKRDLEPKQVFLMLWIFAMLAIIFAPRELTHIFPDKMLYFIYIPIMAIAAKGLVDFSAKYNLNRKRVLLAVFIIALPTIAFSNISLQMQTRYNPALNYTAFYSPDVFETLEFLEKQDMGTVIAPESVGINVPFMTGKRVMRIDHEFGDTIYNYDVKLMDFDKFYSSPSDIDRKSIANKYGITYVIDDSGKLSESEILRKEFESGAVKLYKIV